MAILLLGMHSGNNNSFDSFFFVFLEHFRHNKSLCILTIKKTTFVLPFFLKYILCSTMDVVKLIPFTRHPSAASGGKVRPVDLMLTQSL